MGFRSTLISNDYNVCNLPLWFAEKYKEKLNTYRLISSKFEFKIYNNEIFEDYQKALVESGFFNNAKTFPMGIIVLHEDNTISRVYIWEDKIKYDWFFTPDMEGMETVYTQ